MLASSQLTNRFACILTALTFALLAGCSSDSNPTSGGGGGGGGNSGGVPLASAAAPIPSGLQAAATGSGAALGLGYFNQYNSISSYGSWFTGVPTPVRIGRQAMPADTTVDTVGTLVIRVVVDTAVIEIDTTITWSVVLNGSDSLNSYSDFLFISGYYTTAAPRLSDLGAEGRNHDIPVALTAGLDGQYGSMTVNDRATGNSAVEAWGWNLNPIIEDSYVYSNSGVFIDIFVNLDGSGTLEHTPIGPAGVKTSGFGIDYRANWFADGTGSWTAYNSIGEIDSSGTF